MYGTQASQTSVKTRVVTCNSIVSIVPEVSNSQVHIENYLSSVMICASSICSKDKACEEVDGAVEKESSSDYETDEEAETLRKKELAIDHKEQVSISH